MPLSPIPNLAQLQAFRTSGRFDASLPNQKIDVMKSDSRIVGLKLDGQLVGFGQLERATPDEIARLKTDVSKSAESPDNSIFDDSPLLPDWQPEIQPIGVSEVVQKSAGDAETEPLEGIFPPCLRNN